MPLADTLPRMAEAPRLYLPKWSQTILDEVTRNFIAKWGMAPEKARRREEELHRHFPEAWVEGFEPIIGAMTNDPGDRHVLAAAGALSLRVDRHLQWSPPSSGFPAIMGDRCAGSVRVVCRQAA
jgi:hypothetical protein